MKVYTKAQITKALLLSKTMTRKEAAKKAGLKNVYVLNYYLSKKASPAVKKVILNSAHMRAIKTLSTLLRNVA